MQSESSQTDRSRSSSKLLMLLILFGIILISINESVRGEQFNIQWAALLIISAAMLVRLKGTVKAAWCGAVAAIRLEK